MFVKFVWSYNNQMRALIDATNAQRGKIAALGVVILNIQRIFKKIVPNDFQETGLFHNPYLDDCLVDVACTDERCVGHIGFEDCQCAGLSREYGLGFVVVEDAVVRDVEFAFGQAAE